MPALIFIPLALCVLFFLTGLFIDHREVHVAGIGSALIVLVIIFAVVYSTVWMPLFKELYRHA